MNAARGLLSTVLVALCALAGVFALGGTARAAVIHEYLSTPIVEVPAKGPPPLEEPVAQPGPLSEINDMTVDFGGVYVLDNSGGRLDRFAAGTGAFETQFSQFPLASPYYDFQQGMAVGHGAGETQVYVGGDEQGSEGTQGVVAVFGATGSLQGFWKGADTPAGNFGCFECGGYGGIAVDNSGNPLTSGLVYVLAPLQHAVDVFEPKAGGGEKYVTQITGPEAGVPFTALGGSTDSVSVDQETGDVLVMEGNQTVGNYAVDVFEPIALGEYALVRKLTGTPAGAFQQLGGVNAGGPGGDIYVWQNGQEGEAGVVDQFSATGVYLGHLTGTSSTPSGAFGKVTAVAVDPATGDVYVANMRQLVSGRVTSVDIFGPNLVVPDVTSGPASSVNTRGATLNGTVNSDEAGAATCQFEWGTSTSLGKLAPCEPEGVADGNSPVAVHAVLSGLQTDTTYYYRLRASNANGTNPGEAFQDQQFITPGPGIHAESASAVTAGSATLHAAIDPNGASTAYYFQFGTTASYGSSVPAAPGLGLGAGRRDLPVSVHLQGILADTAYHYRVVAVSEPGGEPVTVDGPDGVFTTQVADAEVTQPDGRQWELVSPPNKQGAGIIAVGNEQGDDIQAAVDGGAITYGATAPFVANPAGNRSIEVAQVLSRRGAPGVWQTADISTPHNEGVAEFAVGHASEYKLFSSDLSFGLVEPVDATPLPPLPAGSERTLYLREADGGYKALVTSANVAPGVKFGNEEGGALVDFTTASPDFSHVVLESSLKLTSAPEPASKGRVLYEWAGGHLQLASVLPDGESTAAFLGGGEQVRHAISDDGSRLVWKVVGLSEGSHGNPIRNCPRTRQV